MSQSMPLRFRPVYLISLSAVTTPTLSTMPPYSVLLIYHHEPPRRMLLSLATVISKSLSFATSTSALKFLRYPCSTLSASVYINLMSILVHLSHVLHLNQNQSFHSTSHDDSRGISFQTHRFACPCI